MNEISLVQSKNAETVPLLRVKLACLTGKT